MALTLMPLGMRCQLQCAYCYQDVQRHAQKIDGDYDIPAMKTALLNASRGPEHFVLFGGEPLLLPKPVLENLWAWGYERSGANSIQTNGCLIDSDHIAMFKKFNVQVGISMDGPGALNDARWDHTLARTRTSTEKTQAAISLLCASGIPPSLIVTLHRLNAVGESLETLIKWFQYLRTCGVKTIGLHLCEIRTSEQRRRFALTIDEHLCLVRRLRAAERDLPGLEFTLLRDLESMLLGKDKRSKCLWQSCDPYTTPAFRPISGHGDRTTCCRNHVEGIAFLPAPRAGYVSHPGYCGVTCHVYFRPFVRGSELSDVEK